MPGTDDREANRLSGRIKRYAQVGGGLTNVAVRLAAGRLAGNELDSPAEAERLRLALGGLKGPLMKVAQLLATIPDLLPPNYAAELTQLQANAPAMGWPFVKRRMAAELGVDWLSKFERFEREAAAAASLGQVHRAVSPAGKSVACKLQYPDMQSAVEADLAQLGVIFAVYQRMDRAINTKEIASEIGDRLREELDYVREARHMALYRDVLSAVDTITVPDVHDTLSTGRLITMSWLEGRPLLDFTDASQDVRNFLVRQLFTAWWMPFSRYGVIHGDPHLGNYTAVASSQDGVTGLNLLDFGCIRLFPPRFAGGVVDLYHGLLHEDEDRIVHAYETWGFAALNRELIEVLNIWARFIYGPLLDDRVRALADGVSPAHYGRKEAFRVHQALKEKGPVTVPREFVFMDRAAIGLGGVFLRLGAKLNFFELFNQTIEGFDLAALTTRQARAFDKAGLEVPS